MKTRLTHGSLFSGIGGFDLAAEWAGWTNVFQCEIEEFCQRVLRYHFPDTDLYDNIKTTDFTQYYGTIDIISGGFPCQPFSQSGKRKGTEDDRYLWPEMLRVIREVSPHWVVGENVLGIVNWSGGLVFEQVCADLEAAGYEVIPYVLPACGVNAPHRRYRTWFIAHAKSQRGAEHYISGKPDKQGFIGRTHNEGIAPHTNVYDARRCGHGETGRTPGKGESEQEERERIWDKSERTGEEKSITDTESQQSKRMQSEQRGIGEEEQMEFRRGDSKSGYYRPVPNWENFPTQSPICWRNDGFSDRLDGITFSGWRGQSVKAYGNAIVPQVAYGIFRTINEFEAS